MTGAIEPIKPVTPDAVQATPEEVATFRKYCDWLALWRHCAEPACRRARACAGDPVPCFVRFDVDCPEPARTWVRIGIVAMEDGSTPRGATMVADTAMLARLKIDARLPVPRPRWRRRRVG